MSTQFSHLVWLGAGTATEPENLLGHAENVTLFEARKTACTQLEKAYQQENITIKQVVLTVEGAPIEFTEYNLAEYSAVSALAGLKALFPGIKPIKSERVKSISITEAIKALALENSNNLLVVDIADCNLALLLALQKSNQINRFSEIYIQAGNESIYDGAATVAEIKAFLQSQGYTLQHTNSHDPDLPWMLFGRNPLWQTLQEAQQANSILVNELEQVKEQLVAANKKLVEGNLLSEQIKFESSNLRNTPDEQQKKLKIETELTKKLKHAEQKKIELEQKLAAATQDLAVEKKRSIELTTKVDAQLNIIKLLEGSVGSNPGELQEKEDEIRKSFQAEQEKISKQLLNKSKQVKEKQEQIEELILAKKALELDRVNLKIKLDGCAEQLARADAQYQLIKDLILARGLNSNG